MPIPILPCCSAIGTLCRPSSPICFQTARSKPSSVWIAARSFGTAASRPRNSRARSRRPIWSGENSKSTGLLPAQPVGADLTREAQDPLADDVLLDLRGAGIDHAGAGPEEVV